MSSSYNFGPYLIAHEDGARLAAIPKAGELLSPRSVTTDLSKAARFETWGAASDASQNFGPEWIVEEAS